MFENSAARLVTFDPYLGSARVGEVRLPQALVDQLDERLQAFRGDQGGATPDQYGRDLQPRDDDRWLLTLIRPTDACVVAIVLSLDDDPVHAFSIPCDERTRDYLPFTSITPDGDCFIAGHPLGVSRWCP